MHFEKISKMTLENSTRNFSADTGEVKYRIDGSLLLMLLTPQERPTAIAPRTLVDRSYCNDITGLVAK